MIGKPRAGAPALPHPIQVPRLRNSAAVAGTKRKWEWAWLALASLILLGTGAAAAKLIFTRVSTIDASLSTMAANQLLSEALHVTQRLRLAATEAESPAAAQAMDQGIQALSALASPAHPSMLPGYDLVGPEVDALRALIPPALSELQRLRARPDTSPLLVQRLSGLEREVERLRGRGAETAARRAARLAETAYIPGLIRALVVAALIALAIFVLLMLRSRSRMGVANRELANWADDTARLMAAIPGVLVRARKGPDGVRRRSFVGEAVTAMTGHSVEEALSPGWLRDNIPAEEIGPLFQAFDEALAGEQRSATVRFRRKDGRIIRVRLLMSRHIEENGGPELLSLWSDVTREHELTERLAHTSKLAHMGELMSGMAHELNQPLTSITLAAENAARLATQDPMNVPRLREKLDVVITMAMRASALIERLRDFIREDEDPKLPLQLKPILAAARELTQNRMHLGGVTLTLDLPAELPRILGRSILVEQVLTQLISNACDAYAAMDPQPETRPLTITAREVGDLVQVTVEDQAGGIPDALLPRIFEPFFTTKAVGQGTGLGLSSSFGIMQELGGSISAENHAGGARLTLNFRRA
jgi:PAS domain S-box-containing protein